MIRLSLSGWGAVAGSMLAPERSPEPPTPEACELELLETLTPPASLWAGLRFTPERFEVLCQANPEAVLELAADGSLILMTPTGSETGARNGSLMVVLGLALRFSGLPLKLFDSSTGFRLPDGSELSPELLRGFAPLCPDLVMELASGSGARLGWLLIPAKQAGEVGGRRWNPRPSLGGSRRPPAWMGHLRFQDW